MGCFRDTEGKPSTFRRLKNKLSSKSSKTATPDTNVELPTPPRSETPSAGRPSPVDPKNPLNPQVQTLPTPPLTPSPPENDETPVEPPTETPPTPPRQKPSAENLWDEAIEGLDEKHKAMLRGVDTSGNRIDVLNGLLQAVQQRHEEVEARQWKINFRGKAIVLRDVTSNILGWVQKYMSIGDLVATFEPTVGAPWAVIRFMVQLGTGDSEMMGQMLVAVEHITNLLDRCELYEALHVRNNENPTKPQLHLRKTLITLYTAVLEFLMEAMQYISMNTAARAFSSIGEEGAFDTSGIEGLELTISMAFSVAEADNTRSAQINLNDTAQATLRALLDDVCAPLVKIEDDVSELRREVEAKQRLQILDYYSKLPYGLHHKRASLDRVEGTGQWLLHTDQYQKWTSSEQTSVLWIHGVPGTGKTRLSSAIIDHLSASVPSGEAVIYHYCNRKESERNRLDSIMRSLLRQLSTGTRGGPIDDVLVADYNKRKLDAFAAGVPNLDESIKLLKAILAKRTTGCYFVIDGLDERGETDGEIWEFLAGLHTSSEASPAYTKIVVASRDNRDIVSWMKAAENVHSVYLGAGANHNAADLEKYVRSYVQRCIDNGELLEGNVDDALRDKICKTLVKNANGMFDWCREQIERICQCSFSSEIGDFLNERPQAINDTYDEAFRTISNQKGAAAMIGLSALRWATWSTEPLTLAGLSDAIYTELRARDILVSRREITVEIIEKCSSYLVVADRETGYWRTSHVTVAEYIKARDDQSQLAFEAFAANICLRVLIECANASFDRSVPDGGLEPYSLKHWLTHVLASSETAEFFPEEVMEPLSVFMGTPEHPTDAFLYWYHSLQQQHQPLDIDIKKVLPHLRAQNINALSMAAGYGFYVREFWESRNYDPNQRNRCSEPLLAIALSTCQHDPKSVCGHRQVVHMLISRGADVNITCGRDDYPLLSYPVLADNYSYVEVLLRSGAKPDAVAQSGNSLMQIAITQGSEKIVQLLIRYGADVNYRAGYFGTTLQCASYLGNIDLVRLLLAKGADPNLIGGHWNSALEAAIGGREYEIAKLLLDSGARASYPPSFTPSSRYGSPLLASCHPYRYNLPFLDELLGHVTPEDLNDSGGDMGPPLAVAASVGGSAQVAVVDRLLEKGADPNSAGGIYGSMIGAAALDGNKEVLLRAVSANANMDIEAGFIGTPLAMACWSNHSDWKNDIIQFFLRNGADVNHVYGEYGTPLQCAAANGKLSLVEELLAAGADVNVFTPGGYGSALQAAISTGRYQIEQLLRSKGAEVNPTVSGAIQQPPTVWRVTDITRDILSPDHLEACYAMSNIRPYTVLANHPIPLTADYFYFEITLSAANPKNIQPPKYYPHFTIGLAHECIPTWARPGDIEDTVLESWGYHAETGELRSYPDANSARDMLLTKHISYREGDTVGMGVFPKKRTAFYTLNGEVFGTGAVGLKGRLFPAIWLGSPVRARVNFGAEEFRYAGGRDVEKAREDAGKKYGEWRDPLPPPDTF